MCKSSQSVFKTDKNAIDLVEKENSMNTLARTAIVGLVVLLGAAGCRETTTMEGRGGKKLSVTKPSSLTIKQGATEQAKISITRTNFTEPVEVRFDKLPPGVTLVEKKTEIPSNDSSATYTFKADDNAPVVSNHEATVTVAGPGDLRSTENFPITINKK
jgi:hypothetical protein